MINDEGLHLDHFFEYSQDLMAVGGGDGYFKVLNAAWTTALGWQLDELRIKPIVEFIHPDDMQMCMAELNKLADGGVVAEFEHRFLCKDDSYRWLQWNATPRGQLFYATARDITEARKIRSRLKRSESFLESVLEHLPNMVFVKDAKDLEFVHINRAGEDLLGFTRDELIGKNDFDFFSDKEAEQFVSTDRSVLDVGVTVDVPYETIQTRYNGERILHTKKVPIFDNNGAPAFLLGIADDITERIDLRQLIRRQDSLEAAFDASPDAIVMLDQDHRIEGINESIEEISGYGGEGQLGQSPLEFVHEDDRARVEAALNAVQQDLTISKTVRFRIEHERGHYVLVEARARAIVAKSGRSSGAVVVLRDLTEPVDVSETTAALV